jgi:hypothetical protein
VTGPTGNTGPTGATGAVGTTGPTGTISVNGRTVGIELIIDSGITGTAITTGPAGDIEVPFNALLQEVTMFGGPTGSIIVEIWKDTYANFPPTVADAIYSSTPPIINNGIKSKDSTLASWGTTFTSGDILRFNVTGGTGPTGIERVTISLKALKDE